LSSLIEKLSKVVEFEIDVVRDVVPIHESLPSLFALECAAQPFVEIRVALLLIWDTFK
jgi:hypothetical protein